MPRSRGPPSAGGAAGASAEMSVASQQQEELLKKIKDAQGAPERCKALIQNLGKVIGGLQKRRHDTGVAVERDREEIAQIERQQAMLRHRLDPLLDGLERKQEEFAALKEQYDQLRAQTQGLIGAVGSDRRRANREGMQRLKATIPANPYHEAFKKSQRRGRSVRVSTSTGGVQRSTRTVGVSSRRPSGAGSTGSGSGSPSLPAV